jgi:hypothetical protein
VAWSLHRSVKRAATQQNVADSKAMLRPPGVVGVGRGAFYNQGHGSTLSMDQLVNRGRKENGADAFRNANTSTPSQNLFFSPTAAGAGQGGMQQPGGNRASSYMPAGYYAAGTGAPGGQGGMTTIGGQGGGHQYSRSRNVSPPSSPGLPASRDGYGRGGPQYGPSTSTLNLSTLNAPAQPGQRVPSAYLEDLFDQNPPPNPNQGRHNNGNVPGY